MGGTVTEAVTDFALTVSEAVADAAAIDESPANVALTPDPYVPALMPARLLALSSVEHSVDTAHLPTGDDPLSTPATARDIARVNTRIDDLRALLLG